MTWGAVAGAAVGVIGSAMKDDEQPSGGGGRQAAQAANQQSRADIGWVNDLNWSNQMRAQELNAEAINKALLANRANQTSDFGSLTWEQDPETGVWTQTNKLAPELQEQLTGLRGKYGDLIDSMGGEFGINNDVMKAYRAQMQPGLDQQRSAENARLAAMGLGTGSGAAWGGAQDALNRSANDAEQKAILNGFNAWQQGQQNVRANLGALSGLESSWRANSGMPSYANSAAATVNAPVVSQPENRTYEGMMADNDIAMAQAQANAASNDKMWSSLGKGVGSLVDYGSNNGWWGSGSDNGGSTGGLSDGVSNSSDWWSGGVQSNELGGYGLGDYSWDTW